MKKIIQTQSNSICRKCSDTLVTRKHSKITQKQLNKAYYFSQWDYCKRCNAVYFNEAHKVFNHSAKAQTIRGYEDREQQLAFLRSILDT